MREDIDVGEGGDRRRIAVLSRAGRSPPVVWFGGFRSEMTGTKADALDGWAAEAGQAFLRFDYSGHGLSGGRFEEATVSAWLEDALAVVTRFAQGRGIFVGSSMGGWVALLAALRLRRRDPSRAPRGMILLAPAPDFTERLMWEAFPDAVRRTILDEGVYVRPSAYSEEPYPITRRLIEDGRLHLLLGGTIETGCPVHIIQGMQDPDVPWEHAMRLVERLPADAVQLTLVKDGDHRLSRPEDLARLVAAVEATVKAAGPAPTAS